MFPARGRGSRRRLQILRQKRLPRLRARLFARIGLPLRAFVPAKPVEAEMFDAGQVATGIETVFARKEEQAG